MRISELICCVVSVAQSLAQRIYGALDGLVVVLAWWMLNRLVGISAGHSNRRVLVLGWMIDRFAEILSRR